MDKYMLSQLGRIYITQGSCVQLAVAEQVRRCFKQQSPLQATAMTAPDAKDKSNHKKKSAKPTPEEIERLRAERAVKKTQEPVKPVTSSQPYIAR